MVDSTWDYCRYGKNNLIRSNKDDSCIYLPIGSCDGRLLIHWEYWVLLVLFLPVLLADTEASLYVIGRGLQ
jgi:hypothetical protein